MNTQIFWLVPIAYAVHILEETPRFVPWTKKYPWLFTSRFTMRLFIIGNGAFMAYVLASVLLATTYPGKWTFILGLSTASWIFANFLLHAVMTLYTGVYAPGLVTAGAIYVPVSLFIYGSVWQAGMLTPSVAVWSILLGFAVMYLPQLNAVRVYRADRKRQALPQGQDSQTPGWSLPKSMDEKPNLSTEQYSAHLSTTVGHAGHARSAATFQPIRQLRRNNVTDWKALFRPAVSQWVLGDLSPADLPDRVLLPCENPEYYDDGEVVTRLEQVRRRDRFLLGTFEGRQVAVAASSKFGSPSVAMTTDILATAGAKVILGIGYCGAVQPDIACGDLIIVTGAVRDEGTTPHYVPLSFPSIASPTVVTELMKVAVSMNMTYHAGIVWTTDAVLCEDDVQVDYWHKAGVVGVDMEAAALLTVASLRGAQAGVILVASDNPFLKRPTDLSRLRAGYRKALDVALRALSALPRPDSPEKGARSCAPSQ